MQKLRVAAVEVLSDLRLLSLHKLVMLALSKSADVHILVRGAALKLIGQLLHREGWQAQ